ncbi:MAG: HDIG domain-containing metalloprotein, partial [Thermodesulfobacteriota bacterium]
MNIPSQKKCFELIEQMNMMSHIIDHSITVANVAYFLSKKLKNKFPELDINLVTSAALLHDITKTRSFDTKESHAETGGE